MIAAKKEGKKKNQFSNSETNTHWASKETYHFYYRTLNKTHCIKISAESVQSVTPCPDRHNRASVLFCFWTSLSQAFPALETPLNPEHCSMYPLSQDRHPPPFISGKLSLQYLRRDFFRDPKSCLTSYVISLVTDFKKSILSSRGGNGGQWFYFSK